MSSYKTRLCNKVIDQPAFADTVVPFINMFNAGLSPEGRPAGIFFLLGPTGTGKTWSIEALAEILHGSRKNYLRIDCGEFQMEHEVAKLIGAPPGYLGHRETNPVLTQARLLAVKSDKCPLSIVLFDEVEKAADSMHRLLLGVMDKSSLRLGDSSVVNFDRTLIFFTSNVGAADLDTAKKKNFSFTRTDDANTVSTNIVMNALEKKFPSEFLNRIDRRIVFNSLSRKSNQRILDIMIADIRDLLMARLGENHFFFILTQSAKQFLLDEGTNERYGARELRRCVEKFILHPMAEKYIGGGIPPKSIVNITKKGDGLSFTVKATTGLSLVA